MRRPGSSDLTVVGLALGATAVLTAAGAVVSPVSQGTADGSTYSAAPGGARAAFLLLKETGRRVERSFEPITAITAEPSRTVLILAAPLQKASEQDRRALRQFVQRGGIVLATGDVGAGFLGSRHGEEVPDDESKSTYHPVTPSALAARAPAITMAPEIVAPRLEGAYQAIYGSGPAAVVLASRPEAGRAIWWAGATPLTNAAIADESNLVLLLNVVGGGDRLILWDEYYHGHARSLWSYVAATPLPWAGAQALALAAAALFTYSRRRGPARPPVADARTSPMEFVETMGGLYEQAGAAPAAVAAARARLCRALGGVSGMAPGASDDRLAASAASRTGVDGAELRDLLDASRDAAVRQPALRPADALPLVRRLQAMTAALLSVRRK